MRPTASSPTLCGGQPTFLDSLSMRPYIGQSAHISSIDTRVMPTPLPSCGQPGWILKNIPIIYVFPNQPSSSPLPPPLNQTRSHINETAKFERPPIENVCSSLQLVISMVVIIYSTPTYTQPPPTSNGGRASLCSISGIISRGKLAFPGWTWSTAVVALVAVA